MTACCAMIAFRLLIYIVLILAAELFDKGAVYAPTADPGIDRINIWATIDKNIIVYLIISTCLLAFIGETLWKLFFIALQSYRKNLK